MSRPGRSSGLIAFCHIPKTAGVSLTHLIRRYFGLRHIDVQHRKVYLYKPRDLRVDLKLYPFARSLAGHPLRPYVDFQEFQDRIRWYTILREPVSRYLSQYAYEVEHLGETQDFETWNTRDLRGRVNRQVRYLAGADDFEAAKQILNERFGLVGLMEHFDESLLLLRQRLGLRGFRVDYKRAMNTASQRKGIILKRIKEDFEKYRDLVMENNELDLKLYEFVKRDIWPKQVAEYGREKLALDLACEFPRRGSTLMEKCRWFSGFAYRNVVYKPFACLDRRLSRTDGGESGQVPLGG